MDKAHIKTDAELRKLELELKRIYANTLEDIIAQIKAEYKVIEKNNAPSARKEIKRLKTILRRVVIEAGNTNIIAMDMMQKELEKVVEINDKFAYSQVLDIMEKQGLNLSFGLLDRKAIDEVLRGDAFKEVAIEAFEDKNRIMTQLRRAMAQSLIAGEGAEKMAARIQKVMANEHYEAIRIARTETTKAQNISRDKHYKEAAELGIKFEKKWHSAGDARVRPSHAELDGVQIPYKEQFKNGCDFPGVGGSASEVIMCRCTFTAEMEDY